MSTEPSTNIVHAATQHVNAVMQRKIGDRSQGVGLLARKQMRIDASWTNARIVGCAFVVSGCDTPTRLDLLKNRSIKLGVR